MDDQIEMNKRVLEIDLENKNFSKQIDEATKLIKKLDDSVNTLAKSLSRIETKDIDIQTSQAVTNINSLTTETEAASKQFSNLQLIATGAMLEIGSTITRVGISALNKFNSVLNQIVSGGMRRSQNIANAKFMIEGLGQSWNNLVGDIEYGVNDTAYGLDAAAKVAGSLLASNVKVGDSMQTALRAISGVAAMTNRTYEDIGSIFTTVAGNGRLMTMQLRQLSASGLNAAAVLGKQLKKSESEIYDMVTKGKISFAEFSKAMYDAFGEHAVKANETYAGSLSNLNAALSRLGQDFATSYFEMMKNFYNEVKPTFVAIKDALKPIMDLYDEITRVITKFTKSLFDNREVVHNYVDSTTGKVTQVTEKVSHWTDAVKAAVSNVSDFIIAIVNGFKKVFSYQQYFGDIGAHFKSWADSMKLSENALEQLSNVTAGFATILKVIMELIDAVVDVASDVGVALKDGFESGADAGYIIGTILWRISQVARTIIIIIKYIAKFLIRTLSPILSQILDFVVKKAVPIFKFVGGLFLKALTIGNNIMAGAIKGIKDNAPKLFDTIISTFSNVLTLICDIFGINSPSKRMIEIFDFLVAGGVKSLNKKENTKALSDATTKLMKGAVIDPVTNTVLKGASSAVGELDDNVSDIAEKTDSLRSGISELVDSIVDAVKNSKEGSLSDLKTVLKSALGDIIVIVGLLSVIAFVSKAFVKPLTKINDVIEQILHKTKTIWLVLGVIVTFIVLSKLLDAYLGESNVILNGIKDVIDVIKDAINGLVDRIFSLRTIVDIFMAGIINLVGAISLPILLVGAAVAAIVFKILGGLAEIISDGLSDIASAIVKLALLVIGIALITTAIEYLGELIPELKDALDDAADKMVDVIDSISGFISSLGKFGIGFAVLLYAISKVVNPLAEFVKQLTTFVVVLLLCTIVGIILYNEWEDFKAVIDIIYNAIVRFANWVGEILQPGLVVIIITVVMVIKTLTTIGTLADKIRGVVSTFKNSASIGVELKATITSVFLSIAAVLLSIGVVMYIIKKTVDENPWYEIATIIFLAMMMLSVTIGGMVAILAIASQGINSLEVVDEKTAKVANKAKKELANAYNSIISTFTSAIKSVTGILISISLMIGILKLFGVTPEEFCGYILPYIALLAVVGISLSLMVKAMKTIKENGLVTDELLKEVNSILKNITKPLLGVSVSMLGIIGALYLFSSIRDSLKVGDYIFVFVTLSIVLGIMAGYLIVINEIIEKAPENAQRLADTLNSLYKPLLSLCVGVVLLTGVLAIVSGLNIKWSWDALGIVASSIVLVFIILGALLLLSNYMAKHEDVLASFELLMEKVGKIIIGFGAFIIIVAACVAIMSIAEPGEMWSAIGVIAVASMLLMGIVAAIAIVAYVISENLDMLTSFEKTSKLIIGIMIGFGVTMLLIGGAMLMISALSWDQILSVIPVVIITVLSIIALIVVGAELGKLLNSVGPTIVGGMVIAAGMAVVTVIIISLMANVIKSLEDMPASTILAATVSLLAMFGLMTILIVMSAVIGTLIMSAWQIVIPALIGLAVIAVFALALWGISAILANAVESMSDAADRISLESLTNLTTLISSFANPIPFALALVSVGLLSLFAIGLLAAMTLLSLIPWDEYSPSVLAASQLLTTLADAIISFANSVTINLDDAVISLNDSIISIMTSLSILGSLSIQEMIDGISSAAPYLVSALISAIDTAYNSAMEYLNVKDGRSEKFRILGESIANGFNAGMRSMSKDISVTAKNVMKDAPIDAVSAAYKLDENGNSKLMNSLGKNIVLSDAKGMSDNADIPVKTQLEISKSIVKASDNSDEMKESGEESSEKYAEGTAEKIPEAAASGAGLSGGILSVIKGFLPSFGELGQTSGVAVVQGIMGALSSAADGLGYVISLITGNEEVAAQYEAEAASSGGLSLGGFDLSSIGDLNFDDIVSQISEQLGIDFDFGGSSGKNPNRSAGSWSAAVANDPRLSGVTQDEDTYKIMKDYGISLDGLTDILKDFDIPELTGAMNEISDVWSETNPLDNEAWAYGKPDDESKTTDDATNASTLNTSSKTSTSNYKASQASHSMGNITGSNNQINNGGNTVQYIQNNYSPKALSRSELYTQTRNQLNSMRGLSMSN